MYLGVSFLFISCNSLLWWYFTTFVLEFYKSRKKQVLQAAAPIMTLLKAENTVNIFFKHMNKIFAVKAQKGQSILAAAHKNNIPLEGACDGNLACSTCHVICEESVFRQKEVTDRENDLLDLAYGLKPTSRLGCQVIVDDYMKDKTFEIPRATRNLAIDGYKPPLHH